MPPPDGVIPSVAWTLQPAGVHFDPPAQLTLPNSDGLLPGSIIEIYQFDHDIFEFVSVGRATVSEDGLTMTTDPGFGVSRTGWGAPRPRPRRPTQPEECDDRDSCAEEVFENGECKQINKKPVGTDCVVEGGFQVVLNSGGETGFAIDESCAIGGCDSNGHCLIPDPFFENGQAKDKSGGRWDPEIISASIPNAINTLFSCLPSPLQATVLGGFNDIIEGDKKEFKIACNSGPEVKVCGQSKKGGGAGQIDITTDSIFGCGPMDMTLFHEMFHDLTGVNHNQPDGSNTDYANDLTSACVKKCFLQQGREADLRKHFGTLSDGTEVLDLVNEGLCQ